MVLLHLLIKSATASSTFGDGLDTLMTTRTSTNASVVERLKLFSLR